jgi:hypothetical protein
MQYEQEGSKKKLVITRRKMRDMDKVKNAVKRPGSAFEAHENPYTLTTYPPEESLQPSENAKQSPIILPVRSSNPTKLKLYSVHDQDDLTATLAPQHTEKVHKDDSSDSEHMKEKDPSYKLKMSVRTVKKRKHEVLGEIGEIDEIPIDRDAIMGNFTHGDSALDDNVKYEPREHQTSLSDVPQLTT